MPLAVTGAFMATAAAPARQRGAVSPLVISRSASRRSPTSPPSTWRLCPG
jgi:hypothetical protein